MPEASQHQEALLQKRLSEIVGSVRTLALSDLDYDADADEPLAIKAADTDEPGRLIAQFSVAGVKDSYGDIIVQEAFDAINARETAMVWAHKRDEIIGRGVIRMEGKRAIWDGQLFVGKHVPRAEEAHTIIKEMGRLQEYSWGFRIKKAEPIKEKGPDGQLYWTGGFKITEVDPAEVSPVLKGAHPKTKTISIKSDDKPTTESTPAEALAEAAEEGMTVPSQFEAALAAVSGFTARMQALDAMRMEERGRHLSAENQGRLTDLLAALDESRVQIEAVLKTAQADAGVPVGERFRFAEARRRKFEHLTTGA